MLSVFLRLSCSMNVDPGLRALIIFSTDSMQYNQYLCMGHPDPRPKPFVKHRLGFWSEFQSESSTIVALMSEVMEEMRF